MSFIHLVHNTIFHKNIISKKMLFAVCRVLHPEKNTSKSYRLPGKLPKVRFELLGSVTLDKIPYLMHLKKVAPQNVAFHINATVAEKKNVLKHSKVLLHAFKGEHFGIALVEAMSAGAIPVTHNSGAAKEDKLVPIRFRYNDHEEATRCVTDALRLLECWRS